MANYPLPIEQLESTVGYTFTNRDVLQRALTHSSYSNEMGVANHHLLCNERLEFLGDSVLSIVTSEFLFEHFKDCPEGDLTRMRADVVCERALAKYADKIELGNYLLLGRGEDRNNGRSCKSIIADAFEALLAALYLDAGKAKVTEFLLPFIREEIETLKPGGFTGDFKTRLQQFVQQNEGDFLEYVTVGESGPDHRKVFEVNAKLNDNIIGRGTGHSKREAEQRAARAALVLFGIEKE